MFDIITDILIPLIVGIFGVIATNCYASYISHRQEKSVLVLLIREFTLLIDRITMYYDQFLNQRISFSTLFEISDSTTFIKLSELTNNNEVIEAALKLKADFFQVIRHADEASEHLNKNDSKSARLSQSKSLLFFLGDVISNGEFKRIRYLSYLERIYFLLNYLQELNTPFGVNKYIINFFPSLKKGKITTDNFIAQIKKDLKERRNELETLREIESKNVGIQLKT